MTQDPTGIGPSGLGPIGRTPSTTSRGESSQATSGAGAAFKALLEKLENEAKALHEVGAELEGPEELPRAVEAAAESIADAQSLGDQLVEAYRAARQRTSGNEAGKPAENQEDAPNERRDS